MAPTKDKGHDYTICTMDVLKACDARADMGQL